MIVGYGIAAWPFLAAKYELHERRRALTALMIGVAAILAALLISGGARAATLARPSDARSGSLILKAEGEGYADADRPWSVTLPLANAAEGRGLSKFWARRKIADAEVAQSVRTLTIDEANKAILALALEHQLVTRLTSLVAVDKPVTRPAGEPLKVSELPLNLPAGWDFEKIFGERPKPVPAAAPVERRADERDGRTRLAMRGASPAVSTVTQPQQGVVLPATATDAEWRMIMGTVLMTFALIVFAYRRRRVFA